MQCKWQVEIDDYANRVLEKHWPDVERIRDITTFEPGTRHAVDLLCGGFPCQDLSSAGKRVGLHGTKSSLFFELVRVVRCLEPRFLVLENVAALLVRGMGTVLAELAQSGYDVQWQCIPAAAVGAPHIRDRIFLFAQRSLPDANGIANRVQQQQDGNQQRNVSAGQQKSNLGSEFNDLCKTSRIEIGEFWRIEPRIRRVVDGVPDRVDRIRCLGNSIVPQIAEFIGRSIIEGMTENNFVFKFEREKKLFTGRA